MDIERTLFVGGSAFGFREGCQAVVVEMTDRSAIRVIYAPGVTLDKPWSASPRNGWSPTPMTAPDRRRRFFEGAFRGCDGGERPLGDLPGALERPGAFYKVVNGGEGIAIIAPRAKLAGYFYFG
jgi:hypothetical protein